MDRKVALVTVRTSGECATGHLPGAHDVPLDHLDAAPPAIKAAAGLGDLLVVYASGARSARARATPAENDIVAAPPTGGDGRDTW
ncbi:rhodanese-like domain-containing protein [Streptomyces roseolus]|uniref:rhodanese-like domain-containing protein n=1 Tax=Streptomyces roseolus TaxID=67358 RepID=UPI0016749886|nr:rhodanese-like domain-containing protein [Streptomyces roseolus]GGR36963.1 hypothetical protein GCM10010282_31870 [Streptomyces roseolus]